MCCRKASLALIRKMVHYMTAPLLAEISSPDYLTTNFGSQLVEVLAVVLDSEVTTVSLDEIIPSEDINACKRFYITK